MDEMRGTYASEFAAHGLNGGIRGIYASEFAAHGLNDGMRGINCF